MDHVDFVHTSGMDESDVVELLRTQDHGVLGLADDNDAYAVPLSYHYDGERLRFRVSTHDADEEKRRFLETTDTATFVCYDATTEGSWSVIVRGAVHPWEGTIDDATLNEWFQPFRLFDEPIEEVEFSLYQLEMDAVTGRRTVE